MRRRLAVIVAVLLALGAWGSLPYGSVEAAVTIRVAPAAYPSDCFWRVVSWTYDYATGTCGYVPDGASFVTIVTCRDSWHTFTSVGFRQWDAYDNSTARCADPSEMVGARISLAGS